MMRGPETEGHTHGGESDDLLGNMIEVLRQNADDPPAEVKGVPNTFLDELERVPKKALKKEDTCPICVNPFLDGKFRFSTSIRRQLIREPKTHIRSSYSYPATRTTGSTLSVSHLG